MNTVTMREASHNLPKVIEDTIKNYDETIIVSDTGAVVMVAQDGEVLLNEAPLLLLLQPPQSTDQAHHILVPLVTVGFLLMLIDHAASIPKDFV